MGDPKILADNSAVITALFSGIAGSVLTLAVQWAAKWLYRPVLEATFSVSEPGCDVSTPTDLPGTSQHYLRIKVKNAGRTFARNVAVCVTSIEFLSPSGRKSEFAEEVADLNLALGLGRTTFNIASKGHRFFDVAHTQQTGSQVAFGFDFAIQPLRLGHLGFGVGTYSLKIFVSAENAKSVSTSISLRWNGQYHGLNIV